MLRNKFAAEKCILISTFEKEAITVLRCSDIYNVLKYNINYKYSHMTQRVLISFSIAFYTSKSNKWNYNLRVLSQTTKQNHVYGETYVHTYIHINTYIYTYI